MDLSLKEIKDYVDITKHSLYSERSLKLIYRYAYLYEVLSVLLVLFIIRNSQISLRHQPVTRLYLFLIFLRFQNDNRYS
jgi:hypothetical protein